MDKHESEKEQTGENIHFFLDFLNKKFRNLNKKLREIETLESLKEIKLEQQKKIDGKGALLSQLKEYEEIKSLFLQAEKEAGKAAKPKPQVTTLKQQDRHPVIKPTMNLIHLSQIYANSSNKEEMRSHAAKPEDLDIFTEFSQNLFGLNKASHAHNKYDVYLNHCYHELDRYLNSSEDVALHNLSYKYILENVEKYVNSQYFRELTTKPQAVLQVETVVHEPAVQQEQPVLHEKEKSPEQSPLKSPIKPQQNPPDSPNQMLIEEDKPQEIEEPVVHKEEQEYGPEGKFEEDHHEKKNTHGYHRGGGRGGGYKKGGGRGRGHYHKKQFHEDHHHGDHSDEEGHHQHQHNDHTEEGEQKPEQDADGFITVKSKFEKKVQHDKDFKGSGGYVRGRGHKRNYHKKSGGEHRHHEENEEESRERQHQEYKEHRENDSPGQRNKKGFHRGKGGMVKEYIRKE